MKELADLASEVDEMTALVRLLADARETLEILAGEPGAEEEVDLLLRTAQTRIDALEMAANFDRPYDGHDAIISIHAGAGGIDAADWTQMLARMYLRWAERRAFTTQIIDESPGEEAGLKSITFFVRGKNAYGMLESERGVHRLVRISPFDAQHRRHTSFASIDCPRKSGQTNRRIEIRPEDLRIETYKSGGAGGQYVNKTESAIRIIHVPTGSIAASQQERSQTQNRELAMNVLRANSCNAKSKIATANSLSCGAKKANEWGSQIRSYVLQPYTMVNDHRTDVKVSDASGVIDGQIDPFIWPYLQQRERFAPSDAGART